MSIYFQKKNNKVNIERVFFNDVEYKVVECDDKVIIEPSRGEIYDGCYYSLNDDDTAYTVSKYDDMSHIEIPATYNGLPVGRISGWQDDGDISTVNVSTAYLNVDDYAFTNSSISEFNTLGSDKIGLGSMGVGYHSFENCRNLHTVKAGIMSLGSYSFRNCSSLSYIILGNTYIPSECFDGCSSLSTVYFLGSESEWQSLLLIQEQIPDIIKNADIYFYSEDIPEYGELYPHWHYDVNGNPIIWDTNGCDHSYEEHSIKEATCTESGYTVYECRVCGHYKVTYTAPSYGHVFGTTGVLSPPPTCTSTGKRVRQCACGECRTEKIAKLCHTFGEWHISKKPTCTTDGYKWRSCDNGCGKCEWKGIEALGHTRGDYTPMSEATCYSKGYNECECRTCGETYIEEIPTIDHDWGEWYTVNEPTEEEDGLLRRECQRNGCDAYEERVVATWGDIDYSLFTFVVYAKGYGVQAAEGVELPQVLKIPNRTKEGSPVYAITANGFSENIYLNEVLLPDTIEIIGTSSFFNCIMLGPELRIPTSVTKIYPNAFGQCSGIRHIIFDPRSNGNTISLESGCFSWCSGIQELNIPKFVSYIASDAFEGCYNVESITVDEDNEIYHSDGNCLIYTATNKIILACKNSTIPTSTSSIGSGAFYGNTYFAPIKIPLSVTHIDSLAFGGKPVTVYVESATKPDGWADDWCDENVEVVWGNTDADCTEHSWSPWAATTLATCTTKGEATRACSVCGIRETKMIDNINHKWKAATCIKPKTCIFCGATEGGLLGHDWSDWEDVHPASCEVDGMRERECCICGEIETELIKATGHDWDVEVEVVEPTCTEDGYTLHTCNACGDTHKEITKALGHNMVNGVCTRCGYSEKKGVVYYGISAIPETYNSAFVLGLENRMASNSHLSSISARPLAGEYIYYCAPTSFGECAFMFNNFVGGFTLIETISVTNAGGKTEAYNIYKSNQANLGVNGAITITIKGMG